MSDAMFLGLNIVIDNMNLNPEEIEYYSTVLDSWNNHLVRPKYILEFKDFFIIRPSITFFGKQDPDEYKTTKIGEEGKPVPIGFEYNSFNNPHYLTVKEIVEFLEQQVK